MKNIEIIIPSVLVFVFCAIAGPILAVHYLPIIIPLLMSGIGIGFISIFLFFQANFWLIFGFICLNFWLKMLISDGVRSGMQNNQ